ncbi:hypothetical protein BV25DRAFT_1706624 [Artomyces pyxidatus]|uniref:Uncharacterized protein n=1 Tax=Artomyces pyxidatus TaxID=48021 RepID=A0ACB8T9R6_9AGAM|nr:hypothetical protein BV25DRAFT_1706624 [Artomyces pyxidatus]
MSGIITDSVALQYTIELAACGMLDGPHGGQSLDITDRLRRLRLYDAAWRTLSWTKEEKSTCFDGFWSPSLDSNMLIFRKLDLVLPGQLSCYMIPSMLRGVDEQRFDLAMQGSSHIGIDVSQDLFIFLDRLSSQYHLRAIATGDPHPLACNNGVIHTAQGQPIISIIEIREDFLLEAIKRRGVIEYSVWNWKTGITEYKAVEPLSSRYEARCEPHSRESAWSCGL